MTSSLTKPTNLMKLCAAAITTVLVTGCAAPLAFVQPNSSIEGIRVQAASIQVLQPFTFRPALYTATYPAGLYLPKFEDKDGVYFKAPDQILGRTVAGGRTMQGGIYVSKRSWSEYRAYIDEGGELFRFKIDVPVELKVVQ